MKNKPFLFLVAFLTLVSLSITAKAYTITGTLGNANQCYYPKVYLAVINNINGFHSADASALIASATIDDAGNFTLSGNDLPDDLRFYRLYLTEDSNINTGIRMGGGRNYIVLALNNNATVDIQADNICENNFGYTLNDLSGSNNGMPQVQFITDSYDRQMLAATTATKRDFITKKEDAVLKEFTDTVVNPMAALWALCELGIDSLYQHDALFLKGFATDFAHKGNALYARQLNEKIRQLDAIYYVPPAANSVTVWVLGVLLCCSLLLNVYLVVKRKNKQSGSIAHPGVEMLNDSTADESTPELMTIKEREILAMIHQGLTNKEIADRLNIETSTVKTHVSRIYQKNGIKSRKEVAAIVKQLEKEE